MNRGRSRAEQGQGNDGHAIGAAVGLGPGVQHDGVDATIAQSLSQPQEMLTYVTAIEAAASGRHPSATLALTGAEANGRDLLPDDDPVNAAEGSTLPRRSAGPIWTRPPDPAALATEISDEVEAAFRANRPEDRGIDAGARAWRAAIICHFMLDRAFGPKFHYDDVRRFIHDEYPCGRSYGPAVMLFLDDLAARGVLRKSKMRYAWLAEEPSSSPTPVLELF